MLVFDKLHLDRSHLQGLYRDMLRIRRFEAKCVELYQAQAIRAEARRTFPESRPPASTNN